jgi:hypothetical protein
VLPAATLSAAVFSIVMAAHFRCQRRSEPVVTPTLEVTDGERSDSRQAGAAAVAVAGTAT